MWIKFKKLDIESICNNDWLELNDGPSRSYLYISGKKFCGRSTPTELYKTSGNFMTMYFESDFSIEGTGFDLTVEPSVTKYMENYCDHTFHMIAFDQIRLKLTKSKNYLPHFSCKVTLQTDSYKRIMFYFRELRTEGSGDCYNDWLELHDGPSDSHPNLAGGKLCGRSTPSGVYTSNQDYITLYFESDSTVQDTGFDMIITTFKYRTCGVWYSGFICENNRCINANLTCNGYNSCGDYSDCTTRTCRADEYKCQNGRCIPSDLTCNDQNPCGDFSDCTTTSTRWTTRLVYYTPERATDSSMSVGTIIGISVSCILTLVVLIVVITAYGIKKIRLRDQPRYEPEVSTANSQDCMSYAYNNPIALNYSDPPPPYPVITDSTVANQSMPPPYTCLAATPTANQETRPPYPVSTTTHTTHQDRTMPVYPGIIASTVSNQASPPPYPGVNAFPATNQETMSPYPDITAMPSATAGTLPTNTDNSATTGGNSVTTLWSTDFLARSDHNHGVPSSYPIIVAAPTTNQGEDHACPDNTVSTAANQIPIAPDPGIIDTAKGTPCHYGPYPKHTSVPSTNQYLSNTVVPATDHGRLPPYPGHLANSAIKQETTSVATVTTSVATVTTSVATVTTSVADVTSSVADVTTSVANVTTSVADVNQPSSISDC